MFGLNKIERALRKAKNAASYNNSYNKPNQVEFSEAVSVIIKYKESAYYELIGLMKKSVENKWQKEFLLLLKALDGCSIKNIISEKSVSRIIGNAHGGYNCKNNADDLNCLKKILSSMIDAGWKYNSIDTLDALIKYDSIEILKFLMSKGFNAQHERQARPVISNALSIEIIDFLLSIGVEYLSIENKHALYFMIDSPYSRPFKIMPEILDCYAKHGKSVDYRYDEICEDYMYNNKYDVLCNKTPIVQIIYLPDEENDDHVRTIAKFIDLGVDLYDGEAYAYTYAINKEKYKIAELLIEKTPLSGIEGQNRYVNKLYEEINNRTENNYISIKIERVLYLLSKKGAKPFVLTNNKIVEDILTSKYYDQSSDKNIPF